MLTIASVLTPSAPMPNAIDGPAASEATSSGASDFLALLGGVKPGKKAKATGATAAKPSATPVATPPAAAPTTKTGNAEKAENDKPAASGATGEGGKAVVVARTALKAAVTEAKANGEAAKVQLGAEMSASIMAALGVFGKAKAGTETTVAGAAETATAMANATPVTEEGGKTKTKPPRTANRRDVAETAKPETGAKTAETPQPGAKPVKAEAEHVAPTPQRPAETSQPPLATKQTGDEAQPAVLPVEAQVSEARIPLASREAAQAGIAAPILAMRVVTKDGVAKSIEIRLDPAELGQVDVKLETGHDGRLQAVLSTESADAFELLKKDSGALEAALREAGIDLADGAITFALNDSAADHSHQREAAYGGASARRDAAEGELVAAAAAQTSSWRHGVLDISV
ncbi:MAG: flagellar hook-length control protein FliK [Micropepsaceae bacterium]